jgi:gamma-glutamylputrescine oxidase
MLPFDQWSYWEKNTFLQDVDFLIIGSGIVGTSTAIHLRKKYPDAKILIVERGLVPMGASSKNAGFACFGSVTELVDDLEKFDEDTVWETVVNRYEGLDYLKSMYGVENFDFQRNGSWDLLTSGKNYSRELETLPYLNEKMHQLCGEKDVYSFDKEVHKRFGFIGIEGGFYNRLEAQIDTGKLLKQLYNKLAEHNILQLFGIEVTSVQDEQVQCNLGLLKAKHILITTNGFAKQFLPDEDVFPARAQVLITKPIPNLSIQGTFHYDRGYYYFRNIHNRILFGGGRNLDFKGETTTTIEVTKLIVNDLKDKLKTMILPNTPFEIDSVWAGIMGVGNTKKPIVKKIKSNLGVGVRMGGMGVAIGSVVGKKLADLF